jgi:hypothetical protein
MVSKVIAVLLFAVLSLAFVWLYNNFEHPRPLLILTTIAGVAAVRRK